MASLMNKSPLEGDGLIENLYHYLWEKDGLDRGPTGVRIPDTVVFKLRSPVAWYFTSSKDSTIKRKRSVNMTMAKIEEGFLSNRGSSGVVAYFIDSKSLSGKHRSSDLLGTVAEMFLFQETAGLFRLVVAKPAWLCSKPLHWCPVGIRCFWRSCRASNRVFRRGWLEAVSQVPEKASQWHPAEVCRAKGRQELNDQSRLGSQAVPLRAPRKYKAPLGYKI